MDCGNPGNISIDPEASSLVDSASLAELLSVSIDLIIVVPV